MTRATWPSIVLPAAFIIPASPARAMMLAGWRTPIRAASKAMDESGKGAVNCIYQNVGVSAELMVNTVGPGKIMLGGQIEISGTREAPAIGAGGEKAPQFGTFQQAVR